MTKVRRQKKRKSYNTSINRKRLKNRLQNQGSIKCPILKKSWNRSQSTNNNLRKMGLVYDTNKTFKIKSFRDQERETARKVVSEHGFIVTKTEKVEPSKKKSAVIEELTKEAKAPREKTLRLPKSHIEQITYFMDKYGSDFKAMERDRQNHWQETWKQLRNKVKKFMSAPKLYAEYLKSKGIFDKESDDEDELQNEAKALQMDSD